MSTSRHREKPGVSHSNTWYGYWFDLQNQTTGKFGGNLPTRYSNPITNGDGYPVSEVMDDYTSDPGEGRIFHPVSHTVTQWVPLQSIRRFTFAAPKHPMEQRQYCWVKCDGSGETFPNPDWTSMFNNLAAKLNGSLACGYQVLVTVGEATKTIAMIRNPFGLLRTNWRKLARYHPPATLVKGGANLFLEKRYGWDSLWYDIKNACKTFQRIEETAHPSSSPDFAEDRLSVKDEQVIGKGSWIGSNTSLCEGIDANNTYGPLHLTVTGVRSRRLAGGAITRVGCWQTLAIAERWKRTHAILNAFGLTSDVLADAIWELIPFSFVVDWFVDPLGLWHLPGSISRLNRADVKDLHYSKKIVVTYDVQWNPAYGLYYGGPWAYTNWVTREPGGHFETQKCVTKKYYRGLLTDSSLWSLASSRLFSSGLSVSHGQSGAALAIQRLLRGK